MPDRGPQKKAVNDASQIDDWLPAESEEEEPGELVGHTLLRDDYQVAETRVFVHGQLHSYEVHRVDDSQESKMPETASKGKQKQKRKSKTLPSLQWRS